MERFADALIIKDVLPDHTAESTKDVILNNAPLDNKHNLRKLEIAPSIRRHGAAKTAHIPGPFWRDPG